MNDNPLSPIIGVAAAIDGYMAERGAPANDPIRRYARQIRDISCALTAHLRKEERAASALRALVRAVDRDTAGRFDAILSDESLTPEQVETQVFWVLMDWRAAISHRAAGGQVERHPLDLPGSESPPGDGATVPHNLP